MRALLVVVSLLLLTNTQGCSTTLETFALGAVVGGTLMGCSHACYGD